MSHKRIAPTVKAAGTAELVHYVGGGIAKSDEFGELFILVLNGCEFALSEDGLLTLLEVIAESGKAGPGGVAIRRQP